MSNARFACAINCMDGRVQEPVSSWLKSKLNVEYVDAVTEPGPDKILATGTEAEIESIRKRVGISVNAHKSTSVAVAAHHDCAGNPVSKEEHLKMLDKCVDRIGSWGFGVRIFAFWVGDDWKVELYRDSQEG